MDHKIAELEVRIALLEQVVGVIIDKLEKIVGENKDPRPPAASFSAVEKLLS